MLAATLSSHPCSVLLQPRPLSGGGHWSRNYLDFSWHSEQFQHPGIHRSHNLWVFLFLCHTPTWSSKKYSFVDKRKKRCVLYFTTISWSFIKQEFNIKKYEFRPCFYGNQMNNKHIVDLLDTTSLRPIFAKRWYHFSPCNMCNVTSFFVINIFSVNRIRDF